MDRIICSSVLKEYDLGEKCLSVLPLTGGLLHRMLRLDTESGSYAVKILTPEIVKWPAALGDLEYGEDLARACLQSGIPAVTALRRRGRSVTRLDVAGIGNVSVMVFPYVDAVMNRDPLDPEEAAKLMGALHGIHQTGIRGKQGKEGIADAAFPVYAQRAEKAGEPFAPLLFSLVPELVRIQEAAGKALQNAENRIVISHRDLDRKNVLWDRQRHPYLIDWESAGPVPRAQEVIDVALSWAQKDDGSVDLPQFVLLVDSYEALGDRFSEQEKRNGFYESFLPRLGWLRYSLDRALEGDGEDRQAGREQTELTLRQIRGILSRESAVI